MKTPRTFRFLWLVVIVACLASGCATTKQKTTSVEDHGFGRPGGCCVGVGEAPALKWSDYVFMPLAFAGWLLSASP
jgi:hypothetical protein